MKRPNLTKEELRLIGTWPNVTGTSEVAPITLSTFTSGIDPFGNTFGYDVAAFHNQRAMSLRKRYKLLPHCWPDSLIR